MQTQPCDLQRSILGEHNVMDFTIEIWSLDSERGALVHVREVQRPKPESALDCYDATIITRAEDSDIPLSSSGAIFERLSQPERESKSPPRSDDDDGDVLIRQLVDRVTRSSAKGESTAQERGTMAMVAGRAALEKQFKAARNASNQCSIE